MITETINYIKMCEKAKKIQKAWKPKSGDNFSDPDYEVGMILLFPVTKEQKKQFIKDKIWLPTQEQLQEMIFDNNVGVQTICSLIEQFSKSDIGCDISIFGNMNELWLTFVMYEKYHKLWSMAGERWVKAN